MIAGRLEDSATARDPSRGLGRADLDRDRDVVGEPEVADAHFASRSSSSRSSSMIRRRRALNSGSLRAGKGLGVNGELLAAP